MLGFKNFLHEKVTVNGIEINFRHGGKGPALILLHGYPQTHFMWHKIVDELSTQFHVICPDLRGYGDSSKPVGEKEHQNYSKKCMAADIIYLANHLNIESFYIAGHDRGARVTHRLCLDYANRVKKACVMDIAPTYHMFESTNQSFATGYYHWFFLIQPDNLPETMIGANPSYYLMQKLQRWSDKTVNFENKFTQEAVDEYIRCFDKASIHATCEDYRAAATVDMQDDEQDRNRKIDVPLLVLWGEKGFINKTYKPLEVWQNYAKEVSGKTLECGHFLPEEKPDEVISELKQFFTS